jgi:deoxyribodipyrimidine photolyase
MSDWVVCFKRDLRLNDHATLNQAVNVLKELFELAAFANLYAHDPE